MKMYFFFADECEFTGDALTVLLFDSFRGVSVIELAIAFAPIGYIAVVWRFISCDIDMSVLGVRNRWEGFFNQFNDRIFILFGFLVEHLKSSVVDEPETISRPIHLAELMVVVTVDGKVTLSTSDSEPCLSLSRHTAPQCVGSYYEYLLNYPWLTWRGDSDDGVIEDCCRHFYHLI
jgi:hypothetical protein